MVERVRVLEVLADGSPGGGNTAVLGLSGDLTAAGWDVSLITQPGSDALRQAEAKAIAAYGFDFFTSRFDLTIPRRLEPLVREIAPHIVHVHGARSANAFCSRIFQGRSFPLVYTVHGFHYQRKALPMKLLGREAERRIARHADRIVFVSHQDRETALAERFIGQRRDSSSVIVNGISTTDFADLRPLAQSYDIAFVGRAHPQKNPLFMIDIMAALRGRGITMIMVGGGELAEATRARAAELGVADDITFTGPLPRSEALRTLISTKLFVLPSLWEGLPIAPIEAAYCRLPVVASKVSGTMEVVVDGETGVLIDEFDAPTYAARIMELLADEPRRLRMGAAARLRVEENYTRERNSQAHMAMYREVLGGRDN
jgi:glycosyltransferase involved in cell wall biosynthesis